MNNLNNQLNVNTNKISGGLDADAMGSLMNSANMLNSSDDKPNDTSNNANSSDDTSNNSKNDDVDMTKLVKETLQKIHDQMCISIEDNSETLTNNVQNMIIKNSDWKYLGKQLTDVFTNKVSSMLNNIDFMLVANGDNEFPQMNDQNDNDQNDNDQNDNDQNDNDQNNNDEPEPSQEEDAVDEEEKAPDREEDAVDEEEKAPDGEEEKAPDREEDAVDEEEKAPDGEEKEASDQNPNDPPPPVSGGKKRKSIKVKYLSKNKTRKNLI
jgi:hypothetical protein